MLFSHAIAALALSLGLHTNTHLKTTEFVCLVEAIHYEAGNQSHKGKIGVANVIVNRTSSPHFPDTICGVVNQKHQFSYKSTQRFKQHRFNLSNPSVRQRLVESISVAWIALEYDYKDVTHGALYFINPKEAKNTRWVKKLKMTAKIGDHHFYKG